MRGVVDGLDLRALGGEWGWARLDKGIEAVGVDADFTQALAAEHDASVGFEGFADHPAQGDAREGVLGVVVNGTSSDVCSIIN